VKNFFKTAGVIAIAVIIGFSMAACSKAKTADGASGNSGSVKGKGGTLTITDIPAKYNGNYAFFRGTAYNDIVMTEYKSGMGLMGGQETSYLKGCKISNGKVVLSMWLLDSGNTSPYSGSHTIKYEDKDSFELWIGSSDSYTSLASSALAMLYWPSVTFKNGSAALSAKDTNRTWEK